MKEILKKYWYVGVIILCLISLYFAISFDTDMSKLEFEDSLSVEVEEDVVEEISVTSTYYVDIKGEVIKPGVYEVSSDSRVIDVVNKAGGFTKNADTSLLNLSKRVKDEMNIKIYSKEEVKKAKNDLVKEPEVIEIIKEIEKECICPDNNEVCSDNSNKNDVIIESENDADISVNKENDSSSSNSNSSNIVNNNTNLDKVQDSNQTNKEENTKDEESNTSTNLININTATKEELMTLSSIGEAKALKIIAYRNKTKFVKIEDIKNVSGIGDAVFEKIKNSITV